jgi:ubiquinol-cytochrome c reductase cytochrome b subunit
MFFITMAIAFLGYVLPWGQMSYWGATVITRFLTVLPHGQEILHIIWGSWVIGPQTLNRFFILHFILPFVLCLISVFHILLLHSTGSNNPLGVDVKLELVRFHVYYTLKDLVGVLIYLQVLTVLVCFYPAIFLDRLNYFPIDEIETPIGIKPEWYFLFAYAILRGVPNKLGGILSLVFAVLILVLVPHLNRKVKFWTMSYYPINQFLFWWFLCVFFTLSYCGTVLATDEFAGIIGQVDSVLYFSYYFLSPAMCFLNDYFIVDKKLLVL